MSLTNPNVRVFKSRIDSICRRSVALRPQMTTMFAAGEVPSYAEIEAKNVVFVKGVVGEIPAG